MLIAIAAVAGLGYWDAQREARAAFSDFADDQAWLADTAARTLRDRLVALQREVDDTARGSSADFRELPSHLRFSADSSAHAFTNLDPSILVFMAENVHGKTARATISMSDALTPIDPFERSDSRVLIHRSGTPILFTTSGSAAHSPAILAGLTNGDRSMRLARGEAAELGLPERTAIAGFSHIDVGALGLWDVVVVASAQGERDREKRSELRALLSVGVASALVIGFGGVAVRTRTKAIELRHALTVQDLERERDEHLVRADKLATMAALATGIAHEVSTPLGVIVARAEQIIARAQHDEKVRRGGELIVAESERINAVVRGFLELARGAGPRLENADAVAVAAAATRLVAHRFSKASVSLHTQVEADERDTLLIACDARLLEQVLVNLLLNACEACALHGTVELSVRNDATRVFFVVRDNGHGIDAATALRATEPFFTTKAEGTGLGLAITNEIVKHHRGSLRIRGRSSGIGTEAIVELPKSWDRAPEHADA